MNYSPRFNLFFVGMAIYAAVMVVAGLFVPYGKAILFNVLGVLPASLGCLIIGPVLWKQGHRLCVSIPWPGSVSYCLIPAWC